MKDFGRSGVSDGMVLGKDENLFCVADAQATIERLVAEQKITAYRAMQVMEVQHYLLCQCGTTSITHAVLLLFFSLLLLTLPAPCAWVTSFLVEPEDTGNMEDVNEPT